MRSGSVRRFGWGAAFVGALAALIGLPSMPAHGGVPAFARVTKRQAPRHLKAKKKAANMTKKPPPLPPLDGTTYDFDYDGKAEGHPERRWMGRVFVHRKAAALAGQALPVLVFLHGNNAEKIKYRWMGGGQEGDVRRIISEMIETGAVPPMLVAAPSSIDPTTMTAAGLSWPAFNLDIFLDKTIERLNAVAELDRGRVVVAAHSGAGCNIRGGLASALHAKATPVLAGISIDTCMMLDLAKDLAHRSPTTHVVVTWQSISWPERDFASFRTVFLREVKKSPPSPGVLRVLDDPQPRVPAVHDAMVGITLRKYLPPILGPATLPPDPASWGSSKGDFQPVPGAPGGATSTHDAAPRP